MAYNEELTARIRNALSRVAQVEEKKMFRGVAFMINGKMLVTAGDDEIMVRVNPEIHEQVLKNYDCRSMIMKGKELKGYVVFKETELDLDRLNYFVNLALDFNPKAKASKKRKEKNV